jgi:predicted Zn-dependent protease
MLLGRSGLAAATVERPRLIAPWLIFLLGALQLFVLSLLYPFQILVDRVVANNRGDPLTTSYLHNLLRTDPQNPELRLVLARQQYAADDLAAARSSVEPVVASDDPQLHADGLWLRWRVNEKEYLSIPPGSLERQRALRTLRRELRQLAGQQWPEAMQAELARKALAYGERELALRIYDRLSERQGVLGAHWYVQAGQQALGDSEYGAAAEFYLVARRRAITLAEKREHFLSAMRAMQAGNLGREALSMAEKELNELREDRETLLYLIGLARASNRMDLADKYARVLLRLSLLEQLRRAVIASDPALFDATRLRRVAFPAEPTERPGPELPFDDRIYTLGYEVFLGNRKPEDAYRVAASAVRQVPDNLEWRERLAKAAEWTARPRVALENWLFIARRSGSEEAWAGVLRLAPGLFDDEALLAAWQHKLARSPGDQKLTRDIAAAYERLGKPKEALAFLHRLAGAAPAPWLLEETAALAERAGEDERAIAALEELIRRDGASVPHSIRLSTLLAVRGRLREAFAALERARPVAADRDTVFWRLYAEFARRLQEDTAAIAAYERILRFDEAQEADYNALVALLRDEFPLQAARVAEAGWRKFGKPQMLLASLNLLAAKAQWQDMARLFSELKPEQAAALEVDAEFLRLRAQHYQMLGKLAAARRDLGRSLALQPDSSILRETLIWLLVDSNDSTALKALLAAQAASWGADPALHDALAGAHLALSQPALALRYLTPQLVRRRDDFLWLMNYADALEQNAEVDRAWQLRRHLFRTRKWAGSAAGGEIDEGTLEAARRIARVRLQLSLRPGDPSLAALRELLRADVQDAGQLSSAARELVLSWWQNAGEYHAERGYLWQRYAANMTRPLWAEIGVALAQDDVAELGSLLERHGERLPRYDRVNAARRVGDMPLAATHAADTQNVQPHDDETHLQLTETLLDQAHTAELDLARRIIGPLNEQDRIAQFDFRVLPKVRLGFDVGRIGRSSRDEQAISGVPAAETLVLGRLRVRHGEGETRFTAGRRKSFDTYRPVEIVREQQLTQRLSMTTGLGWRQNAPESAALRVAGMKNQLSLGLQYRFSRYDRVFAQHSRRRFLLQNGTRVGEGNSTDLEYAHAIRTELRDLEGSLFYTRFSFSPRGDLAATADFVPYQLLLPQATQSLLAQPGPTAEEQASIESSVRGLLPSGFRLYGVRLSTNTRLQRDYTRALRPFASVALTRNSVSGGGYGVLLGMAGSILGNDHFQLGWRLDKGGTANFARTREIGLSYRLFF